MIRLVIDPRPDQVARARGVGIGDPHILVISTRDANARSAATPSALTFATNAGIVTADDVTLTSYPSATPHRFWFERFAFVASSVDWSGSHARRGGGTALERYRSAPWPSQSVVTRHYAPRPTLELTHSAPAAPLVLNAPVRSTHTRPRLHPPRTPSFPPGEHDPSSVQAGGAGRRARARRRLSATRGELSALWVTVFATRAAATSLRETNAGS
jgi:hypothetical protein